MSRAVVVCRRGGHGVVVNDDTVHDAAGERVASVFDVVHDSGSTFDVGQDLEVTRR